MTQSIIKNNDDIYVALSQRKEELKLTNRDIASQAAQYGVKIPMQSISKYFNRKEESNLSERAILWMCDRYCIEVLTLIRKLEYNDFEAKLKVKIKYK